MTPADVPIDLSAPEGVTLHVVSQAAGNAGLKGGPDAAALKKAGWMERVGTAAGLWVSVSAQQLYVIENGIVRWSAACSTGRNGIGSLANSEKTPPGWHEVARKIGEKEPWGRIFEARAPTSRTWKPGDKTDADLVLTRIFILEGIEPGINKGKDEQGRVVDSRERYIYIHGTNGEENLGQPVSHGCVRVSNEAVLALFDFISSGSLLYIEP